MKAILKKLTIINFKGIERLELSFDPKENFIFGANGTGKSTISDAYAWLLTGKNSQDKKDFEIKPLDSVGARAQKTENEVSMVLEVDGMDIELRKVQSEKWVKPRGQAEALFTGNEINCFYNGAPEKVGVFQAKINELINEDRLKLFTNTEYFNSLKTDAKRKVLIEMAGDVDRMAIINSNPNFLFVNKLIEQKKSLAEFKRELAAKKKKLKDELEAIPARTDEVKRSMANLERPFERLREDIAKYYPQLATIESSINNKNVAYQTQEDAANAKRKEKHGLVAQSEAISNGLRVSIIGSRNQVDPIVAELNKALSANKNEASALSVEIDELGTRINTGKGKIDAVKEEIQTITNKIESLKTNWKDENTKTKTFGENELCCKECGREYETDDLESRKAEMINTFNTRKQEVMAKIVEKADVLKKEKVGLETDLQKYVDGVKGLEEKLSEAKESLAQLTDVILEAENALTAHLSGDKEDLPSVDDELAAQLLAHEEYQGLLVSIQSIEKELAEFKPVDNVELVAQKTDLQAKIKEIETDLLNEVQIKSSVARIQELSQQQKELAQELADVEKKEFHMMNFDIAEMNEVETRVNAMFKVVRFRMFDRQINGETIAVCDCLINGVPYPDANTASKVAAGLDIINALSEKYDTYAPVFIDARESVTEIPHTLSQVINLIVDPKTEKIRLSNTYDHEALAVA